MRLFALLAIAASLCFSAAPKNAPPLGDAAIEASIRAKFGKSKINEEHFRVTVKGGIATIEGKTEVPQRKGVATRLAKTGGAREVVNKIQVGEAGKQKLAASLQKAREKQASAPPMKPAAPVVKTAVATTPPPSTPEAIHRMQIKH